jgi:hypothetical protein
MEFIMTLSRQIPLNDLVAFLDGAIIDLSARNSKYDEPAHYIEMIRDHVKHVAEHDQKLVYSSRAIGL